LHYYFPGDIQEHDVVVFWTEEDNFDVDALLKGYEQHAIPALVPTACPTFPRSRWTGGELAVNWGDFFHPFMV
jgi:hypothetical protein